VLKGYLDLKGRRKDSTENSIILKYIYFSSFIFRIIKSRRMGWGPCNTHGGGERCLNGFGSETDDQRPRARRRCRWENNIKMEIREIGIDGANCIRLAQDMF